MEHDLPSIPADDEESIARLLRAAGPRAAVPPETAARVRSAARRTWEASLHARRRRRSIRLAAAAAAGLAGLATALWLSRTEPAPRTPSGAGAAIATVVAASGPVHARGDERSRLFLGSVLAAGGGIETGPGGRAALRLPGGASVRLDHGSRLSIESASRMTLEGGAVYVDSGGKGPPLEIRAGAGVARDLGTQFEVRLDAGVTRVRVREGEVAWDQAGRSEKASAGSEIDIDERGEVRRAAISPHGPEWSWVQQVAPPFELEGRTVGEFLDWVSRETGFRVRLEGADAARLAKATVLHGSSSGMSPEEALSAVLPTCGLVHRVENGQIVVSPEAARRGR